MPLGVSTGEFIELPAGYRGLPHPTMGQVHWVDAVSGKGVVAIKDPNGSPLYVPVEPEILRSPMDDLAVEDVAVEA